MFKIKQITSLLAVLAVLFGFATESFAAKKSKTLKNTIKQGFVKCGVSQGLPGFSNADASGNWTGVDVDVCRAVAAAVLGDANKVKFTPLSAKERFTALTSGEIDVLSRNTTWTYSRDVSLGMEFTAITYYDGQGFMVRKDSGFKSAMELKGATVCVATGTTTELNLTDFSRMNKLDIQPVVFSDNNVRNESYLKGNCDALTNDKSGLASNLAGFPDKSAHVILPETISKEPLAPAVRKGDDQWFDIVRWTVFALISAEELGITQANVDEMRKNPPNPEVARFMGVEKEMNKGLGLGKDWAYNIIKGVGNYGEIYDKYMGFGKEGIGIAREGSANDLWTRGGLMYSPPFR